MKTKTDPSSVNFASMTLLCRLREHVITNEGDFVPAGTPVKVMGWKGNHRGGAGYSDGNGDSEKIEVRTSAYMYADEFDYETGTAAVGCGLYLSVSPGDLVFDSIEEEFPRD